MSRSERNTWLFILVYLVGGFLTNSYVRQYRQPVWIQEYQVAPVYPDTPAGRSAVLVVGATVFWPVYILSRVSDSLLSLGMEE